MTDADEGAESSAPDPTDQPPEPRAIEPAVPDEFGLVQVWWGDGKGKTTAALGMGFRSVGHGYRVHLLQFMKGGTPSVEDVRGEYNAIAAVPGFSYETTGHYGWHRRLDDVEDEHAARAQSALDRARELVDGVDQTDRSSPIPSDADPEEGLDMLILDEVLYAANRGLIDPDDLLALMDAKPDALELVLTGGHERPEYVADRADLVSQVRKEVHPIDAGRSARKGTEY
jgi:cob(I)alamin adenosyltransferase